MKIFTYTICIQDGEFEYRDTIKIAAETSAEVDKYVFEKVLPTYWGEETTWDAEQSLATEKVDRRIASYCGAEEMRGGKVRTIDGVLMAWTPVLV